jgi:hypothetical protein
MSKRREALPLPLAVVHNKRTSPCTALSLVSSSPEMSHGLEHVFHFLIALFFPFYFKFQVKFYALKYLLAHTGQECVQANENAPSS